MAKLTKKAKEAASKLIKNRMYSLKDAAALIKVKFLQNLMSLLISRYVCVDPRKANQMVRCGNIASWNW
jgi:large subunit ribosomal protein L1